MIYIIVIYILGVVIAASILTDLLIDNYGILRYEKRKCIKLYLTCVLSWIAVLDLIIFYDNYNEEGFY